MRFVWMLILLIAALLGAGVPVSAHASWPTYTVHAMIDAPIGLDESRRALAVNASGVQLIFVDTPGPGMGYGLCQAGNCISGNPPGGDNNWVVSGLSDSGALAGAIFEGFDVAFAGNDVFGYDRIGCPGCAFIDNLNSQAKGVNTAGMATGWAQFAGGGPARAFRYTVSGGMLDLGTLGGSTSEGLAINAAGDVAGNAQLTGNTVTRAFRFAGGQMIHLGTLGGAASSSYAYDLNDAGKVVGCAYNSAAVPVLQAFRHNGNGMVALPPLANGKPSCALAINNADVAVGRAHNASGAQRAVIFKGQQVKNLNQLLAPGSTGWTLLEAVGINDSGVIVGNGLYNGVMQAFVLQP